VQGTTGPLGAPLLLDAGRAGGARDDRTVAIRHGLNAPAAGVGPMRVAGLIEPERLLELSLPAVPASCPQARHDVSAAVQGRGIDVAAVELAVSEAVTNVVLHAYRDRAEGEHGAIHLRVTAGGGGVWVLVADDGVGMSPRDDSPGLGLGLRVIASASDELWIIQGEPGTRVHMRFAATEARVERPR
jgi:serine/threonine-protein kinase RsbW